MQSRPLQNLDVLAIAFEITRQHLRGFAQIAAGHRTIDLDHAAELGESLGLALLHQKVCVVLDAHGMAAYGQGVLQSVNKCTKYPALYATFAFQERS